MLARPQIRGSASAFRKMEAGLALSSILNQLLCAADVRCSEAREMHMENESGEFTQASPDVAPSARRRLVRGAFAAPVALTLHSGSAFAAASATCVARQVLPGNAVVDATTTATGTWLRVQIWILQPPGGLNYRSTWVSGSSIGAFASGKSITTFIGSDKWLCLNAGGNATIATGGGSETPVQAGQPYTPNPVTPTSIGDGSGTAATVAVASSSDSIAIRVDTNGNIVGVVGLGPDSGTSAVTASCWNSFRA